MRSHLRGVFPVSTALLFMAAAPALYAQSNSGLVDGTVTDPTGAVIPGATVSIINPVSGYHRTSTTDASGHFQFPNVPFNPYHLSVKQAGFGDFVEDVDVTSTVPLNVSVKLDVSGASQTVTVQGEDLIENSPTFHTDIDRDLSKRLPLESQSSSLSSLVTLASPGVAADSNGLFHGLGDHASNSFSIDGQPITDQQSKVFSNQLPSNAVQSLEVISGAPPAEYGGKTSLIINATTRSGQGETKPNGSITSSYGSFGSATGAVDVGYGGPHWGNFFEFDGLNTGRFLDTPEFVILHSRGNEQNVFNRIDKDFTESDSAHVNLNYSRSWFQTPNSFDNLGVSNVISGGSGPDPLFGSVGDTDQKSKIETFDIAPTYTHLFGAKAVFNFGPYVRKDFYSYYPSGNPLADVGTQSQSISQRRTLLNAGVHTDVTLQEGNNNIKAGIQFDHTFLREYDDLALVDATFNSPCMDAAGNPQPGFFDPTQCAAAGLLPNAGAGGGNAYNPLLRAYDLTRGGTFYNYFGHADIKELGLYIQDDLKAGNWVFKLGMRGDLYNGLTVARQAQPRLGASYNIARTNTVLRVSYARTLETPFNENLVLSSEGCSNAVLAPLLLCSPGVNGTMQPGFRNEFHAGFQQAFGKNVVASAEYIWKYTHNAFDFSVLGNTPITFPIDWHNSKIPGFMARVDVPNLHNITAFVVMSSVSARFFPPQSAGAGATVGQSGYPFRIDHDERFNQTTHVQYQLPFKNVPWLGFNWRYDSGLVAGSVPCYNATGDPNSACGTPATLDGQPAINLAATGLTADQEFQAGLECGGVRATPGHPLPDLCPASEFTSTLVRIPALNTGNNDKNPPRIAPRNLFDLSLGADNLFHGDKYKWSLQLTGVNVTNKYALYNFLSTFSGTHYVTPRAMTAQVGFHF